MTRIPAPLVRGLTVLAVGATLVVSHAAFAASGSNIGSIDRSAQVALVSKSDTDRKVTASLLLPDNCYVETQVERTPKGKTVSKLVQECD